MFTIHKISDAGAAFDYFKDRDDYYRSDASSAEWFGAGAERAGLTGDVQSRDLQAVLNGTIGGQQVGHPGRHTAGWDATFSAPKSFSVAALAHGDERLIGAHDQAVRLALEHTEQQVAMTRQRDGAGGYEFRSGEGIVAGLFRHASSRDLDPQLHTHAVIANATYDPAAGKWVSLWSRDGLFKAHLEAETIYQNELARAAREAGYHVEWSVDEHGFPSFELTDISQVEHALFSSRKRAIDAELAMHNITREQATQAQRQAATLATRSPKGHVPAAELHAQWRDRARAAGINIDRELPEAAPAGGMASGDAADDAVANATAQLAERDARFTEGELLNAARTYSAGRASEAELAHALERARKRGELIDTTTRQRAPGGEYAPAPGLTTQAGREIEEAMLSAGETVLALGHDGPRIGESGRHQNTAKAIDKLIAAADHKAQFPLTDEHKAAIRGIVESHDGLSIVQGHAGTAKTTGVLRVVADHARAGEWEVKAMAPTHSAAETLGDAIGSDSVTTSAVVAGADWRHDKPEVWIVDEAGMIGAGDMRRLLDKAAAANAHVILTGDTKQIGSISSGRAFDQLQEELSERTFRLTEIKRQTTDELRQAVLDSIAGDVKAALGRIDVTEQGSRDKAVAEVARQYFDGRDADKETLVVTLSRADREAVNDAIQKERARRGEVQNVHEYDGLAARNMTDTERRDAARWHTGDRVQAARDLAHIAKGEIATVTGVKDGKVVLERNGEQWSFDPKRSKSYMPLKRQALRIGVGDDIVAKGDIRAEDTTGKAGLLKNGTELHVDRIAENGQITAHDKSGRSLKLDTSEGIRADLAYAQTANQAQGKTVDRAIGLMRSSQTNLADQQHEYVTVSRARESASLVTDDKAKLAETLERNTGANETALADQPRNTDRTSAHDRSPGGHKRGHSPVQQKAAGSDRQGDARARAAAHLQSIADRALERDRADRRAVERTAKRYERDLRRQRGEARAKVTKARKEGRARVEKQKLDQALSASRDRTREAIRRAHRRHGWGSAEAARARRRGREERERIELGFKGRGDGKRAQKLDKRELRNLGKDSRLAGKSRREAMNNVRKAHGIFDPERHLKEHAVNKRAREQQERIAVKAGHIRERLDVGKTAPAAPARKAGSRVR